VERINLEQLWHLEGTSLIGQPRTPRTLEAGFLAILRLERNISLANIYYLFHKVKGDTRVVAGTGGLPSKIFEVDAGSKESGEGIHFRTSGIPKLGGMGIPPCGKGLPFQRI
jgi:hypothetical protein